MIGRDVGETRDVESSTGLHSRRSLSRLRVLKVIAALSIPALLLVPQLSHSTLTRYQLKRLSAKIQARAAKLLGQNPEVVLLSGKLVKDGAAGEALKGAQVVAAESTSGYAVLTDRAGNFILPHLLWFPGATYTLFVTVDAHLVRCLSVPSPRELPANGIIEAGDLDFGSGMRISFSDSPVRHLQYDSENRTYYETLFRRLTRNAKTDHERIDAINKYVATRHNPVENAWNFRSPRQTIDLGAPHCANLAFAMSAIVAAGGYPTRTVHASDTAKYTNTHAVTEAYYENAWHVYDPTYGIFFLNSAGSVASYEELRLDPKLITEQAFNNVEPAEVHAAMEWMPGAYASGIHQLYYGGDEAFTNGMGLNDSILTRMFALAGRLLMIGRT